jgi:HAD superfamily hydrolase (TIGR01490 family)
MSKFAVFDIDGTLIRWQLYHSITQKLAAAGELGSGALTTLKTARMKWKRRESPEGFHEYEMAVLSVYENALDTISPKVFDSYIEAVVEKYEDQVYTYTRDLVAALRSENYVLFAVSGSHHELVEKVARHYGFDDWIGTKYERSEKGFTGKKYAPSLDKKAALTNLIEKHGVSFNESVAIGDSASDAAMLEVVENPIAFNPDKKLFKIARQNHWKIVVERKNMIYEIEYKNGNYILAETN